MTTGPRSRVVVGRFLAAVEDRDADAAGACFAPGATYRNVPHPPAVGPDGVRAMLAPVLARSERVAWDVVSASYDDRTAWVERVDRFWIDGEELAVQCHGVFVLTDDGALLQEVRDYVDLGPWRERLARAL